MHDTIVQKVLAIIASCTNEQHIQVATQTVNLVCFEPGVGLSTTQVNHLIHQLNQRIHQLQLELTAARG